MNETENIKTEIETETKIETFMVLGQKVALKTETLSPNERISTKQIIDIVLAEADKLRSNRPNLKDDQLAVLVSLQLARSFLVVEEEFKSSIIALEKQFQLALETIHKSIL